MPPRIMPKKVMTPGSYRIPTPSWKTPQGKTTPKGKTTPQGKTTPPREENASSREEGGTQEEEGEEGEGERQASCSLHGGRHARGHSPSPAGEALHPEGSEGHK